MLFSQINKQISSVGHDRKGGGGSKKGKRRSGGKRRKSKSIINVSVRGDNWNVHTF